MVNGEKTEDGVHKCSTASITILGQSSEEGLREKVYKIRASSNKEAYDALESKYKSYRPKDIYTKLISIGFYRRSFLYYKTMWYWYLSFSLRKQQFRLCTIYYVFRQYSVLRLLVPF